MRKARCGWTMPEVEALSLLRHIEERIRASDIRVEGRAPRRGVGVPVLGGPEGDQAATADSLRTGSSLKVASDSRLM